MRTILPIGLIWAGQVYCQLTVDWDSLPRGTRCTEKIVLLREERPGQFTRPHETAAGLFHPYTDSIGRAVYRKFQDNYDFLLFSGQYYGGNANSVVRGTVSGIGFRKFNNYAWDTIARRLTNIVEVNLYSAYQASLLPPKSIDYRTPWTKLALHELGHKWCCGGKGFYPNPAVEMSAHYHNGIVHFSQDDPWFDPLQYESWVSVGTNPACTSINDTARQARFSNFTQYLMGLIPPEETRNVLVRHWDTTAFNRFQGPACSQFPAFLGERQLTVEEFIRLNGPRIPSAAESQKEFNVLPVFVLRHGDTLNPEFAKFARTILDTLPQAWAAATEGRSKLHMGCELSEWASARPIAKAAGLTFQVADGYLIMPANPSDQGPLRVDLVALDGRFKKALYSGVWPSSPLRLDLGGGGSGGPTSGAYLVRIRTGRQEFIQKISAIRW